MISKKIVMIGNSSGGLYGFRHELIEVLLKQGHHVIILTPFDKRIDALQHMGVELIETPMNRRGTNLLKDFSLFCLYKKLLKELQPDLVITYTIKPNIYGGYACRKLKIPYAVNITGLGTAFQKENALKRIVIYLYKISLKKVKVVFCENSSIKDELTNDKVVSADRVIVLNGAGVNLIKFSYQPYPYNEMFHFLFIGRVMKEKGIEELVTAIEKLNNNGFQCRLVIVGNYEEDYSDTFQEKEYIDFQGPQLDVRPFIANCDCFVLPSYHEGMANANLECAASGRPIITSNIPGCKEAVKDGVSGFLCEPKNVDSLYEVMKKMIEMSYEERKKMGQAGRNHMEEVFDKRKVVEETVKYLLLM